ncbi:MAG: hypothetical protein JWR44_1351 [Hymenobacter sp.]|jgi:hypothetical protein|nr:hypothetical protein [Hymenobacter sp.]
MTDALPPPLLPPTAETAVLLVLLAAPGSARSAPTVSPAALAALQQQLGVAVRVLRIDASTHPSVVSSFHATDLPCFVLVHHGIELWRECGLPEAATLVPLLLSKLGPIPETTPQT